MSAEELELLLEQYLSLDKELAVKITEKEADKVLIGMYEKMERLQGFIRKLGDAIHARNQTFGLAELTARQDDLKEQIRAAWPDPAKKTYKSSQGAVATLRTTKSLIVDSPRAVVDFLAKNDKIEEGVKAFNLAALRQYADAGLLNNGATHYDEKQSVSIKLPEPKEEER